MLMRFCYLDCPEAGLCCYLVIHTENLLHSLQQFYFHLWLIYWLSLVHTCTYRRISSLVTFLLVSYYCHHHHHHHSQSTKRHGRKDSIHIPVLEACGSIVRLRARYSEVFLFFFIPPFNYESLVSHDSFLLYPSQSAIHIQHLLLCLSTSAAWKAPMAQVRIWNINH
jgi:hypothetical protein